MFVCRVNKYGLTENPLTDGAVSILPLTKLLTKYADVGNTHAAFGKSRDRIDDVVQALAVLISVRLEEVETTGKMIQVPFIADRDSDCYSWIEGDSALEVARIDRYAVHALLALVHCHSKGESIRVSANGNILLIACDPPLVTSFHDDLRTIAFWGSVTVRLAANNNGIEIINDCVRL